MASCVVLLSLLAVGGTLGVSVDTGCPAPYATLGGRWCIHVNISATLEGQGRPVTWDAARSHCQTLDGDLVTLEEQEKLWVISKHLDVGFPVETRRGWVYWVGVHKADSLWQWVNGNPANLLSNIWLPDQPSVSSQYARLVPADKVHGRRYLLGDGNNSVSPAFICEVS